MASHLLQVMSQPDSPGMSAHEGRHESQPDRPFRYARSGTLPLKRFRPMAAADEAEELPSDRKGVGGTLYFAANAQILHVLNQ